MTCAVVLVGLVCSATANGILYAIVYGMKRHHRICPHCNVCPYVSPDWRVRGSV